MTEQEKKSLSSITDEYGNHYTILKMCDEGAQGIVYQVIDDNQKIWGFKYLFQYTNVREHLKEIQQIAQEKQKMFQTIEKEAGVRYTWQVYLADDCRTKEGNKVPEGGYLMPFWDLRNTIGYEEVENDDEGVWDYQKICEFSMQVCRALAGYHSAGLCYKDINKGNLRFDTANNCLFILDPDNISVSNPKGESGVKGTGGFIAPEILNDKAMPNRESDCFSAAVFFFYMWAKGHPFEGSAFAPDWNEYFKNPVFIFHPTDPSNSAYTGDFYESVCFWWEQMPEVLRETFVEAFTTGMEPERRVSMRNWYMLFKEISELHLESCQGCGKNIAKSSDMCPYCGKEKKAKKVQKPQSVKSGSSIGNSQSTGSTAAGGSTSGGTAAKSNVVTSSTAKNSAVSGQNGKIEIWDNEKYIGSIRTDQPKYVAGKSISKVLEQYPKVIQVEIFTKDGQQRMVVKNMMEYVNWQVVTKDGQVLTLYPERVAAVDKVKSIRIGFGIEFRFV